MRIVIGGAGEVGRGVAKALRSEGRDVVLIDTDPVSIKEAQALGILDGVTTNPSLMAKEGITGEENIINHYNDFKVYQLILARVTDHV